MPGDLCDFLEQRGQIVHRLPSVLKPSRRAVTQEVQYKAWLGVSYDNDIADTRKIVLKHGRFDWLIIDHYAIDCSWEIAFKEIVKRILVVDDLAMFRHKCDVLVNHTPLPNLENEYRKLVHSNTTLLLGPKYFILGPEYRRARANSKKRDGRVERILVFYGGEDSTNQTRKSLKAISALSLEHISVDVVSSVSGARRDELLELVSKLRSGRLYSRLPSLSLLMANACISLGAGGNTMWERFFMGLPAIVTTTAENQEPAIRYLSEQKLVTWLGDASTVGMHHIQECLSRHLSEPQLLIDQSEKVSSLVDGFGTRRILQVLHSR